jgi:hypothetical protein
MKIVMTLVFLFAPLFSAAESQANGASMTLASTAACKTCDDMKKQEDAFNHLHALVPKQKQKGEAMTDSVLEISERLNAEARGQRGKNFYQEFEPLVGLVAASLPFDMETQGAADIAVIVLSKDADEMKRAPDDKTPTKTQAIYELALGKVRDKCRQEFLREAVNERKCNKNFDDMKKPEAERFKMCPVSKFNYEDCEAKSKS